MTVLFTPVQGLTMITVCIWEWGV